MRLNNVEIGSGPPVVLLHGLFGSARNFGTIQRALSSRFRVVAMDARNHGGSPHAAGMDYATLAADVLETLDAARIKRAAVIGHSMGGKTAMALAVMAPERVDRLLVADIAPVRYDHGNDSVVDAMRAIPLGSGLTRAAAEAALEDAVPNSGVRTFLVQNLQFGPEPRWRIGLEEIADAVPDLEGWETPSGTYPGPTLFVSGAESDYVRPEHRPVIRALFPIARFVNVKNAGHWLHADNPAGFLSVVEAFLYDWKG
jgi:pimeloyl-ACP methyl ester carboxylesterase